MLSAYVVRRVGQAVPSVAGLLVLTFVLLHLAPGDPVVALGGEHGDAAHYAFLRAKFALDRPLAEQLAVYARNALTGDLGTSFAHGQPVARVIAERLPATLLLMSVALILSTAAGVALGVTTARRAHGPADLALRVLAVLGQGLPAFWLAQLAVVTVAIGTGVLPVQGMTDARRAATGLAHALDVARHLVLPVAVLAADELALVTRIVRTSLLDALAADYVRTARAKGLPDKRVTRHALANALLPLATVIGSRVGLLFAGAVLVEAVFAWPGVGQLLLSALLARDYPVVLGVFLLVSAAVVLASLATDLAYAWLDPRIRYR